MSRGRKEKGDSGTKTANAAKLFIKTLRDPFDVPNGLEKLRNLQHCSRNRYSNKIKYKIKVYKSEPNIFWIS